MIITMDDQYDKKKSVQILNVFLANEDVFIRRGREGAEKQPKANLEAALKKKIEKNRFSGQGGFNVKRKFTKPPVDKSLKI